MEITMDISTLVIIAIAGWLGWHLRGITILARLGSDPEHFIKILEEIKNINKKEESETLEKKVGTELEIERHGDQLFAFIKDTNQFVAQGKNLPELLEQAQKRFPGRKFFGFLDKENSAKELV